MREKFTRFKILSGFVFIVLTLASPHAKTEADSVFVLRTDQLPAGQEVKASGRKLISQPHGFTRITAPSNEDDSILNVAVHGYKSEGYEWVAPLVKMAQVFKYTFFYRYDWDICPDSAARILASALDTLIAHSPGTEKLVLLGHSYGGVVVTFCASLLHFNIPVEVHSIAAPLAGIQLLAKCESISRENGQVVFPHWSKNVTHIQWRTIHRLDNAFNKFPDDPQETDLPDSKFFRLPPTMDGHRLGHNWSVTWVIDEYLGIPHKP